MSRAQQGTPLAGASRPARTDATSDPWLRTCFEASVRAQLGASARRHLAGSLLPAILFVKGRAGSCETAGGGILSGPDGEALVKALPRLGFHPEEWCACLLVLPDGSALVDDDLVGVIGVLDPLVTVALDGDATLAVTRALGLPRAPRPLAPVTHLARPVVSVDGFETMLSTQDGKRRAWEQLRVARRPEEPF